MQLAVLGPVVLTGEAGVVTVTPRKARELLTLLALAHPRPLSIDVLTDRLWDEPPPSAVKTIQGLLSRLRSSLAAAGGTDPGISGGPAGYRLAGVDAIDVVELDRLVRNGRQAMAAGTWTVAVNALGEARRLFRGEPELPRTRPGDAQRTSLEERRDGIIDDHVEAAIRAGHLDGAISDLEVLTAAQPLRERRWELRMIALARAGRVAEALRVYGRARAVLVEEVGIEPGERLQRVEGELLAGLLPSVTSTSPVPSPSRPAANAAPVGGVPRAEVRYVEVDDVHVAYCTVGDGDHDIVIMHPGTLPVDCVLTEPRLAAAIDRLSSFARVTWLDRRGIGLSDRCTADRLPTVDDWVHDLTAVLDAIGSAAPIVYACEDTTVVALELAVRRPERLTGIVLTNAHARFTRSDDYPYGFDPVLAEQSASEVAAAEPPDGGFDLLSLIAPSVAADDDFRSWWDETGRRGATPQVARALRSRHQNDDLRSLIARVDVPVLHLVNPTALAHDPGHDRYLEAHLVHIDTVELPGPDELWWLDRSGIFHAEVERFTREGAPLAARRGERQDRS